eukprot:3851303-Pleurochrysis_carterae.AAC.2
MMIDLLLPFRDLQQPIPCSLVPPFITKERLRLCWEQVSQIRSLLPQFYCRPHKGDHHPFDDHPMQYGVPLLFFTLKMALQYVEPNPASRRLAYHALEKLSRYLITWLSGADVPPPPPAAALSVQPGALRSYRLSYGTGQRLCFVFDGFWREGVVVRPPDATRCTHALRMSVGVDSFEREVDLDAHSHTCIPLYAYDAGHPLELLTRVGHWKECIVVNRTPGCNQYIVRMGPAGNQYWALLLPWNHRSLALHASVPLFAVHGYSESNWGNSGSLDAIGEGDEAADRLEKREGHNLDESVSIQARSLASILCAASHRLTIGSARLPAHCPTRSSCC